MGIRGAGTKFERKKILFLCQINGGRSIMAEALMNHFSGGLFRAYSAGLQPVETVPKMVLKVLQSHGIKTGLLRPKSIASLQTLGIDFDFVISTCDRTVGEACPTWVGQPVRAHWNIPSPNQMTDPIRFEQELHEMYNLVYRCVNMFLNLPIETMDKFALSKTLDEIGEKILPDHYIASKPAAVFAAVS